jgi:hypothetical protein
VKVDGAYFGGNVKPANRPVSNGEQFLMATVTALAHPVSPQWKGYWQRGEFKAQARETPCCTAIPGKSLRTSMLTKVGDLP